METIRKGQSWEFAYGSQVNERNIKAARALLAEALETDMKMGAANGKYLEAVAFAVDRHGAVRQARKGTEFPYAVHPLRVGELLDRFGFPEKVVVAGILHDLLEDTDTLLGEIHERFGEDVAVYVSKASEEDKSLPWKSGRKRRYQRSGRKATLTRSL